MKVWKRGAVFLLSLMLLLLQCPVAVLAEYGADALDSGASTYDGRRANANMEKGLIDCEITEYSSIMWPETLSINPSEGELAKSDVFRIIATTGMTASGVPAETEIKNVEIVSSALEGKVEVCKYEYNKWGRDDGYYFSLVKGQIPLAGTYSVKLKITMANGVEDVTTKGLSLFIEESDPAFVDGEAVFQVKSFNDFSGKHISNTICLNTSVRFADRIEILDQENDYRASDYNIIDFNPENATFKLEWIPDENQTGEIHPATSISIQVHWKARRSPANYRIPVYYQVEGMKTVLGVDYQKQINSDKDRSSDLEVQLSEELKMAFKDRVPRIEFGVTNFKSSIGTPQNPTNGFFLDGDLVSLGGRIFASKIGNYSAVFDIIVREFYFEKNNVLWKVNETIFKDQKIEVSIPAQEDETWIVFEREGSVIDIEDPSTYRVKVSCGNYMMGKPYIENVELIPPEDGECISINQFTIENVKPLDGWAWDKSNTNNNFQRVGVTFDLVLKNENYTMTPQEASNLIGGSQYFNFKAILSDGSIDDGEQQEGHPLKIPVKVPFSPAFYSLDNNKEITTDAIYPGEIKKYFVKTNGNAQIVGGMEVTASDGLSILKGEVIGARGYITVRYLPDWIYGIGDSMNLIVSCSVVPKLSNPSVKIRFPEKDEEGKPFTAYFFTSLDLAPSHQNKSQQTVKINGKDFYILVSHLADKDNLFSSAEQKYSFVKEAFQDVPEANRVVYNVDLLDYDTWEPAASPGGRIPVTLPYPDDSRQSDRFVILHMPEGKTPEIIKSYKKTDDGLSFEVDSLSPFIVGYLPNTGLGDVNGDGSISVVDVFMLHKYLLRKVSLDDDQILRGDINGDGQITLVDIFKMHKFILKKITNLG